jgi:proteasome lid subunit RPN8/RPN11
MGGGRQVVDVALCNKETVVSERIGTGGQKLRVGGSLPRLLAGTAGLMLLLGLEPESSLIMEHAEAHEHTEAHTAPVRLGAASGVVLSGQARRYLALQFKAYPTEFMGCMIGERRGNTIVVQRIAPADVDSAQSKATHVVPRTTCEQAGWTGTVGMIHSHPKATSCWYYFPGTQVSTSDLQSFARQPYPVDAIMCGDTLVWIARDYHERRVPLNGGEAPVRTAPAVPTRGNQVASMAGSSGR